VEDVSMSDQNQSLRDPTGYAPPRVERELTLAELWRGILCAGDAVSADSAVDE
jgi:hypothetical protein